MGAETGKDLVVRMMQDKEFMQGVERGLRDIEQGRYSTLEEVKRRLGDLDATLSELEQQERAGR